MIVFMIGSLLAGFAPSILSLIIFRGITGAGGGGILSMVQIVMSDVVSLRERGKYQGIIGVVVAFGFAIGPFIGGVLAEKVSWRVCIRFITESWAFDDLEMVLFFVVVFLDHFAGVCSVYCSGCSSPTTQTGRRGLQKVSFVSLVRLDSLV